MAAAILLQRGVVHEANHDIESFIWVFSYCVMRNLLIRSSNQPNPELKGQCKDFREEFALVFAQTTFKKIETMRNHKSPALTFPENPAVNRIIESFMSESLLNLFLDLQDLIYSAHKRRNAAPLTHDQLLEVINTAINSL